MKNERRNTPVPCSLGGDEVQVLLGGPAELVADEAQLRDVVLAGEQRRARQQLREDAAHRPHVNGTAVLLFVGTTDIFCKVRISFDERDTTTTKYQYTYLPGRQA